MIHSCYGFHAFQLDPGGIALVVQDLWYIIYRFFGYSLDFTLRFQLLIGIHRIMQIQHILYQSGLLKFKIVYSSLHRFMTLLKFRMV